MLIFEQFTNCLLDGYLGLIDILQSMKARGIDLNEQEEEMLERSMEKLQSAKFINKGLHYLSRQYEEMKSNGS